MYHNNIDYLLVRLGARGFDYLAPLGDFRLDIGAELLAATAHGRERERRETLLHVGQTQDADDLRDYYKLGEEIVVYEDNEDLLRKVKYYLAHPKEREEIARRGYERTIREHSAGKRFEYIFKMMGKPL